MKTTKKLLALLLALIMVLSMAACADTGDNGDNGNTTAAPNSGNTGNNGNNGDNGDDPVVETPDLGGFELIMADWWSALEYEEGTPTTAMGQLITDYRHELYDTMNFSFQQIGLSSLGDYHEVLVNSMLTKDGMFNIFQPKPESVTSMASQGLLVDLYTVPELHLENNDLWSQKIIDYYTIGGKCYAARAALDEPRNAIIFNKRIFEDAGLDPNLPYTLYAEGNWDWEHFENLLETLTKDSNNDGVTDIYGLAGGDGDVIDMGIYTNGAMYVDRDEEGYFVDGTLNPAFQEGVEWAVSLIQKGYVESYNNPSASWDEDYVNFAQGKSAMIICQDWVIGSYFTSMNDDYGYILLPAGPNGHSCTTMYPTPIAIPSYLSKEDVTKVGYAYYAFANTAVIDGIEDFGDKTHLDDKYAKFRDTESVELTVDQMMTNPDCQVYDGRYLVPNYNYWSYIVEVAKLNMTAAEAIEALRPENQAAIDAANALFGKS